MSLHVLASLTLSSHSHLSLSGPLLTLQTVAPSSLGSGHLEEENRGHQGPNGNRDPSSGAGAPMYVLRPAESAAPGSFCVSRFGSGESYFPMLQGDAEARPSSGALTLEFRTTTHHQRPGNMEGRELDPVLGFLNFCQ